MQSTIDELLDRIARLEGRNAWLEQRVAELEGRQDAQRYNQPKDLGDEIQDLCNQGRQGCRKQTS